MARIQYRPTHSPCHSSGQDDVGIRIQDHPPPHPHRPPRSHPRCPWLSMQDSSQLAVHVFNCIHHTHDTPCKRVRHQSSSAQPRLLESGIGSVCMPFSRWSSAVGNGRRVFEWSPFLGPLDRFAASQGFCLCPSTAPYSCS